ncbi:Adaptive-response sensory-kinase SasA [compost metagenome]
MWPRSRTSSRISWRTSSRIATRNVLPSSAAPDNAGAAPASTRQAARPGSNISLRVHLLRALATPLFALVLTSGSLSYWLAAHYTTQVFDRALYGVANNIAQQIRIAGPRLEQDIPMIAQTLVEAEGTKEELVPLQILADKLNRQTARSLAALDETQVPAEVAPLIRGLNALLARLRDALDAQRKFIADAAHQLRTPLTAVKLHADRAMEADSPEVARHALREVQTAADRAVRLSNQLLSLARAEPGLSLERLGPVEHFDLAELAFETGAEWVPQALARRIDLGFEILPGPTFTGSTPAVVRGNRLLMREALSNLIDNAVKYVPAGGRITVRAGGEAMGHRGMAVVMIEDNGPGIPPQRREEVFKRFFRGDRAAQSGGAGLGLAIVHEIVTLHQGTIHIEDVPPQPASMQGIKDTEGTPERRPVMRFVIRIPCEPAGSGR